MIHKKDRNITEKTTERNENSDEKSWKWVKDVRQGEKGKVKLKFSFSKKQCFNKYGYYERD